LPEIEEHPTLAPAFENFGPPSAPNVSIVVEEKPPIPRVWFLNPDKTELVQIQKDRFIHNWRKVSGAEPYPRYESIREKFEQEVATLALFLQEEELGPLKINQCEVTYVNHIEPGTLWQRHGQVAIVLKQWSDRGSEGFLPELEDLGLGVRYVMQHEGKPVGRLHVAFQSAWKTKENSPLFTLNLTARGKPLTDNLTGAFRFFDLGRSWIVRAFVALTAEGIQQKAWERTK
jgi:uncharacterized protein (TIGR04255 family)